MIIWATSLGQGRRSGTLSNRQKARAAKAEANSKFWAIGSQRRVGRFLRLKKYGDALLAIYQMEGVPTGPLASIQEKITDCLLAERDAATGQHGVRDGQ